MDITKQVKGTELRKGYNLAEKRTKFLLKILVTQPIRVVVAYAYMLACIDTVSTEKENLL